MALAQDALGAAAVAVLELDSASVGPFLLSRPFVLGPLVGVWRGELWLGAALGAAFEALTLEELPLGGRLEISPGIAAATAAWLVCPPVHLEPAAAFLLGLAAGRAHALLELGARRRRLGAARAEARLSAGRPAALGREIAATLLAQAALGFVVTLAAFAAAGPALARLWPLLPDAIREGARASWLCAPWVGAGGLVASFWRRG
jgi:mannose/fructose/N-acetylgalactosamine-specific phosphotransferase system component IIC